MPDYLRGQATATKMLRASGRKVKLYRVDKSSVEDHYGETEFSVIDDAAEMVELFAVFVPLTGLVQLGMTKLIENQYAQYSKTAMMEVVAGADLTAFTHIEDNGRVAKVARIDALKPGDTLIMYYAAFEG